jgi:hypothetical protein
VSQTTTLMCALELDGTGSAGFGFGLDQGAGIILSSSNTLATFSSAVNLGARSIVTHLPGDGKFYAEIAVGGTPGTSVGIGIHLGAWGTNQGINLRYGIGALSALGNVVGGASLGLPYAAGDVIGISYDAINNFLWWNKNNGSWFGASTTAGNPTVPSGGLATGTVLWPTTLMVGTSSSASPTFTLRDTTGALQYAPPAGFSAWSSAAGPGVIGTQARAMVLA